MVKKESIKELKHKARRESIKEGIFTSAKSSFGDRFLTPFAIAINSSNSLVALLSSISGLLGPMSQLFSSELFGKKSRKKVVLTAVFLEILLWIPFIVIAILFYKGIAIGLLPFFLLLTFSIYTVLYNAAYPPWFSWMGDLVDKGYRGRWFSKRNLIMGFISVLVAIIASFFLDYFEKRNLVMIGFSALFLFALIFRIGSWKAFKKQYEPKLKIKKKIDFAFWDFIKNANKDNFGKFTIFRALLGFTGALFSSLFAVYLLRNLGFSYSTYMIIILAEVVFSLLFMNFWGNLADKYGNHTVMAITIVLIPLTPLLWILSPSPVYLVVVPALASGIIWAGFNLAAGNFIYDNVGKERRGLAVSYYNMLWGVGIFLGAGLAAILIKYLTISFIKPIIFIFILSSIGRMIVVSWWFPKIKEVRKTSKFDPKAFRRSFIKQIRPTMVEEIHEIASIKSYLKS